MEIHASSRYDLKTVASLCRMFRVKKTTPVLHLVLMLIAYGFVAGVCIALGFGRGFDSFIAVLLTVCAVGLCLELVIFFIFPRIQYRNMADLRDAENRFVFRETDFVVTTDGASQKVGVQLGTTGDSYATGDFGDRVTQYSNGNEAVLALNGGEVDCVIIDNEPAKALVNANKGLKILETSYADEDYAICVKKGNNDLLDKINKAIDELVADGTIDAIVAKYIK